MANLLVALDCGLEDRLDADGLLEVDHLKVQVNTPQGVLVQLDDDDRDLLILMQVDDSLQRAIRVGWIWAGDGKQEYYAQSDNQANFIVSPALLNRTPIPVWDGAVVWPKSNKNRANREQSGNRCARRTLNEQFHLTCPRCGWAARHLIVPYYESRFELFGGICSQCCVEAVKSYSRKGWPDERAGSPQERSEAEINDVIGRIFSMPGHRVKKKAKGDSQTTHDELDLTVQRQPPGVG